LEGATRLVERRDRQTYDKGMTTSVRDWA